MKKRFIAIAAILVCMVSVLAGCGKQITGECELCGLKSELYTVTAQGETSHLCKDCADYMKSLGDLMGYTVNISAYTG